MNFEWSDIILHAMERYKTQMFDAEQYLWKHPQTGFKEWEAHSYLKDKFQSMGFAVTEAGEIPGFYFDIDTGKAGPTVGILGELDALLVPAHPDADPNTGAAHACGHHCQVSALLGVAGVLSAPEIQSRLCGKIRIVIVPAEELIELGERLEMRKEGKIKYLSGKSEFMRRGYFDSVDIAFMIHTSAGEKAGLYVGPGTTGIMAKKVTYYGSRNKGGAHPVGGVNALYAAQTALNAINALREIFPENYRVRHHPIITEAGRSVVHLPAEVVVETPVRANDLQVLLEVNDKINRAYTAAALAFGAQIKIEDLELYVPENDCDVPEFMQLAYDVGCDLFGADHVTKTFERNGRSTGGTDMGNLGAVIPVIQPYSTGCVGGAHCPDYQIKYPKYAVYYPAVVQATMACVLLENGGEKARKIIADYTPLYASIQEYCEAMDKIYEQKKPIEYTQAGNATVFW